MSQDAEFLLRALDTEMQEGRDTLSRRGVTAWAVSAAVVSVVAAGLSVLEAGTVSSEHSILVFLTLVAILNLFDSARYVLAASRPAGSVPIRFVSGQPFAAQREVLLAQVLRQIAVAALTMVVWSSLPTYVAVILIGNAAFSVLIVTSIIVWTFTSFPVPVSVAAALFSRPSANRNWDVSLVVALSLQVVVLYGLASSFTLASGASTYADIKLAGLGVLIYLLAPYLPRGFGEAPLIPHLRALRRQVLLGQIDIVSAREALDIALAGMRLDDVLQQDLRTCLDLVERGREGVALMNRQSDELDAAIALVGETSDSGEVARELVREFLAELNRRLDSQEATLDLLACSAKRLAKRTRLLTLVYPVTAQEIAHIHQELDARISELQQAQTTFRTRFRDQPAGVLDMKVDGHPEVAIQG